MKTVTFGNGQVLPYEECYETSEHFDTVLRPTLRLEFIPDDAPLPMLLEIAQNETALASFTLRNDEYSTPMVDENGAAVIKNGIPVMEGLVEHHKLYYSIQVQVSHEPVHREIYDVEKHAVAYRTVLKLARLTKAEIDQNQIKTKLEKLTTALAQSGIQIKA